MEPHPVYSGAEHSPAPTPQASKASVATPIQQAATSGHTKAMHELASAEQEAYNRMEYTLDQERKLYMAETLADIESDSIRRLSLPNGHQDAFYDELGAFRDAFYRDYIKSQTSRFNGLEHGYINPSSADSVKKDILDLKEKITKNLGLKIAANLSDRAKDATLKLAKYQASLGQFEDAIATVEGADPAAFDDVERDSLKLDFSRQRILSDAQAAVNLDDAETYYNLLYNPKTQDVLTPQQYKALQNMESNFLDMDGTVSEDDFNNSLFPDASPPDELPPAEDYTPLTQARQKRSASQVYGLPLGVPDEIVQLFDSWNGDFSDGEAQRQATQLLDEFASSFVTPRMSEHDRALLYNTAKKFKVPGETMDNIIRKYESTFGSFKNFNFQESLSKVDKNFFIPQALHQQISSATAQCAKLAAVDSSRFSKKEKEAHKLKQDEANSMLAQAKEYAQDEKTRLLSSIRSQYADWFTSLSQEQQNSLTENQQKMKLYDIIDSTMDAANKNKYSSPQWDFSSAPDFTLTKDANTKEDAARRDAYERRQDLNTRIEEQDAARAEAAEDEENYSHASRQLAPSVIEVNAAPQDALRLEGSAQQAFLAVPQGSNLSGAMLEVKHNRRTRLLPCIEYDGVSSPTLSMRARTNFGFRPNDAFNIAFDAKGRARFISSAIPPQQQDTYQIMMNNEIGAKPISVHKLISADGGGDWEVAGINVRFHSAEAHKLRDMLNAGASQQELKQEVFSYYRKITQPTADVITPVFNSKGIDLLVRDCSLNCGQAGALAIMRRTLNVATDDDIPSALARFRDSRGQTAFVKAFTQARMAYHTKIASDKPAKAVFLKGWLTRCRNVSQAALNEISSPAF